ncbi:hypothetical protein RIF29_31162 [Crotalaria pallida]|uniref:Uncharacterized protein n=1 Tax=Crotalaria pallida TaxID=3830 RepID=A0AAN9EHE3_CROPI
MQELDMITSPQIETLKKEVSKMIVSANEKPLTKVDLIDSICRLGLQYHFESEIEQVLQQYHNNFVENGEITLEGNLHTLALLFRLFRQEGFRVSPNVFNKFKDVHGNFNESLNVDIEGVLSLHEASHLRFHGEDILDEALVFTSTNLESIATQLSPSLAEQVKYSLRQPLHKGLPRLEARRYISIYRQYPSHNETLLTLAKLDFNMLQKLHQKEFGNITKWWKELDVPKNLPFVRDRIAELCFWILGVHFEPQYSQARTLMMKVISILTIIDDTYDAYGTIDELELFTQAIQRWDISCLDDLPEYMKICYRLLMKSYEETKEDMRMEGREYNLHYVIIEFEQKREHVASFLECYMEQYGVSKEDAINECRKRITNAWKDINEVCLRPTKVPKPFMMRILNLTRFMDVIYKDEDNFTHAGGVMKEYIGALLVDSMPI